MTDTAPDIPSGPAMVIGQFTATADLTVTPADEPAKDTDGE